MVSRLLTDAPLGWTGDAGARFGRYDNLGALMRTGLLVLLPRSLLFILPIYRLLSLAAALTALATFSPAAVEHFLEDGESRRITRVEKTL
jgi:hypothetical protein